MNTAIPNTSTQYPTLECLHRIFIDKLTTGPANPIHIRNLAIDGKHIYAKALLLRLTIKSCFNLSPYASIHRFIAHSLLMMW